ncbi:hypothetical protein [Eubacterium sp.]|uniref:hypothetical protein n=1 Tax=Eubacterium sp. TaxID=142586 RepID=UPI003F0BD1B0
MKDNVEIMTDVFKNAMIFERYTKTWADTLAYINGLLQTNSNKENNALYEIEAEQHKISNVDRQYAEYKYRAKKDVRKYRSIVIIVLATFLLLTAVSGIMYKVGLSTDNSTMIGIGGTVFMILTMTLCPFIVLGVVALGIYKSHVRKKDVKKYTTQNSSLEKTIASNNIVSYNSFLDNTRKEKAYLLSKKQEVTEEYKKSKEILDEIYATDLIPKRYQGLVQTATIYGYLYNGICTNIRGHGGVYERYENDLKLGVIIDRLNMINDKLNTVINNQKLLYDELCSINSELSDIKSEIAAGNKTLSEIRSNSAIAATASAQSAAANSYIATAVWRNS